MRIILSKHGSHDNVGAVLYCSCDNSADAEGRVIQMGRDGQEFDGTR